MLEVSQSQSLVYSTSLLALIKALSMTITTLKSYTGLKKKRTKSMIVARTCSNLKRIVKTMTQEVLCESRIKKSSNSNYHILGSSSQDLLTSSVVSAAVERNARHEVQVTDKE